MTFILNDYIEEYLRKAKSPTNKKIARHLKRIIPQTTHLNENIHSEIIEELIKKIESDREKNFENAFFDVCQKYILRGDIVEAELPCILTRIILSKYKFILNIENQYKKPYARQELKMTLASGNKSRIIRLFRKLQKAWLSKNKVVFATFDEEDKDRDPFLNRTVLEMINMLALNKDVYEDDEPYTAVKIRYRNDEDFDKRYPTFIDAGWCGTFYPAAKKDKYGRTKSSDPSLPNMPEVVHENIKLSEIRIEDFDFLEDK